MAEKDQCGHVNKHSYNHEGLDELACTKPKDHEGLHGALHYERARKISAMLTNEEAEKFTRREIDGELMHEGEIYREWSDIAGTPADEIVPVSPGIEIIQSGQEQDELLAQLAKQVRDLEDRLAEK